DFNLYLL
ncbi:hypothetical protein CP8484711_0706, partial [Chlamydia psittaci 84-8471/1]